MKKTTAFLAAIILAGCESSGDKWQTTTVVAAAPMPSRIRSEAARAPVAIPAGPLTDAQGKALGLRVRASELRFRRAAQGAVRHHKATSNPKAVK